MERLWAPWRIKYILEASKEEGCIFCDKPQQGRDGENLILYRGQRAYVIMNLYPYNSGHLMIVPFRHIGEVEELLDEESLELMKLTQLSIQVLKRVLQPDGFNLGMNLGEISGAGVADHLHVHIVPRWEADTNFMPVLVDTKVISEALEDTYAKLKRGFLELQSTKVDQEAIETSDLSKRR